MLGWRTGGLGLPHRRYTGGGRGAGEGGISLQALQLITNGYTTVNVLPMWVDIHDSLVAAGRVVEEKSVAGTTAALLGLPLKTLRRTLHRDPASVRSETHRAAHSSTSHAGQGVSPPTRTVVAEQRVQSRPRGFVEDAAQVAVAAVSAPTMSSTISRALAPNALRDALMRQTRAGVDHDQLKMEDRLAMGIRIASVCTFLIVNGLSPDLYPKIINMLDPHFPSTFGELNHSVWFANTFRKAALRSLVAEEQQLLCSVLPALRIPSDFARVFDTMTTENGDTLLIHMRIVTTASGRLHAVLGLPLLANEVLPVCSRARLVDDDEPVRNATVLASARQGSEYGKLLMGHHRPDKLADKLLRGEESFGFNILDSRYSKANDIGDGALVGLDSCGVTAELNRREGVRAELHAGETCVWHAAVKVAEHTDNLEAQWPDGLVCKYYHLARQIRKLGAFDASQKDVQINCNTLWQALGAA